MSQGRHPLLGTFTSRGATTFALLLASALGPFACNKSSVSSTATVVPKVGEAASGGEQGAVSQREPVELIAWQVEVEALSDLLAATESVITQLQGAPNSRLSLRPIVEGLATRQGLPARLLQALDWSGRWAIEAAYPQPGQAHAVADDLEFVAKFAVTDPQTALSELPEGWILDSQEGDFRRLRRGELSFDVKAQGQSLLVGRRPGDIARADQLHRATLPARITLRADNLHPGDIDPGALLPLPEAIAAPVGEALKAATAAELLVDFGKQRDLRAHLHASADLTKFGFGFLGRPMAELSPLADRLPSHPVLLVHLSWGDPSLMHEELDRMAKRVPEPFDAWVSDVIKGAHATLDVVRTEAIVALYLNDKGEAAIVVAGAISDQAKASAAVRQVLEGSFALADRYRGLVGDDRDYRFSVDYKPEGLGFSKAKVDLLKATVPKAMLSDAARVRMFLGDKKPALEVLAHIDEHFGLVAIGAGARSVMSDWVRHLGTQRRVSAETDGGLALARRLSEGGRDGSGCQVCVSIDPAQALVLWLRHQQDFDGDTEVAERLAEARKLSSDGSVSFSFRASNKEAALGVGAAKQILFASPPVLPALMKLGDLLPEALEGEPSASAAAASP